MASSRKGMQIYLEISLVNIILECKHKSENLETEIIDLLRETQIIAIVFRRILFSKFDQYGIFFPIKHSIRCSFIISSHALNGLNFP